MRPHTEQELEHYERLVAQLRSVVDRQQGVVDQLTDPGALKLASSLLEQMTETYDLLSKNGPASSDR